MFKPLPELPTIGVFALTYNHEDFIADAIESVLAQGWPQDRLRFVLLDDGSTDATPERVKPYEPYLTYVRQENQGINAAVSRLVGLVDGDVLVPLSGDDMWAPDRLEHLIDYFRAHPDVGMTYGDLEAIDERGRVLVPSLLEPLGTPPEGQVASHLLTGNFINGGSLAVRGELRAAMLPIPADAAWDDWWFAWALTNITRVGYIDEIVYRYRQHRSNFLFGVNARDPAAMLDRHAAEMPFRRYLLGNARPEACTLRSVAGAALEVGQRLLALEAAGRAPETVMTVTDTQRAAARRLVADAAAQTAAAPALAGFAAVRAVAANPLDVDAHRLLQNVAGSPSTIGPPRLSDVRAITIFADAAELADDPSLLATYVAAVGSSDDVTLVTVAREWDGKQLGSRLGPVIDQVDGADRLDILALADHGSAYLTGLIGADAALGLRELPVPGMVRFAEAAALADFIALRRRFPFRGQ